VSGAVFGAFLVTAIRSKKVCVASACTIHAQTVAGAHFTQVVRWAALHAAVLSSVALRASALCHVTYTVARTLVRAIFLTARFTVITYRALAKSNSRRSVAYTMVIAVVWATWERTVVSHESTVALAFTVQALAVLALFRASLVCA